MNNSTFAQNYLENSHNPEMVDLQDVQQMIVEGIQAAEDVATVQAYQELDPQTIVEEINKVACTLEEWKDEEQGKMIKKFEVIEDNGGGLILFVFGENGQCEYAHNGYEYAELEQLTDDIQAITDGADPATDWEGNCTERELDPQECYNFFTDEMQRNGGWELIADNNGIYPEKMGANGKKAFAISCNDEA